MLPDGNQIAEIQCPFKELALFTGAMNVGVEVSSPGASGYLLVDQGETVVAHYSADGRVLAGAQALTEVKKAHDLRFKIFSYTENELEEIVCHARSGGWLISDPAASGGDCALTSEKNRCEPEVEKLGVIAKQPGVIGVSAFFEGFPVLSLGVGDFEHVAAIAEDLLRAGGKISDELCLGNLDQIILETREGKFIIAPYGDIFLCVRTASDANLGLIRLAISGIQ